MSSINDFILQRTGGSSVPDGLASWYSKTTTEALPDAEYRWLSNIDTHGGKSIPDMWYNILTDAGFSGSLSDMQKAYWESSIIFPPEVAGLQLWTRYNSGITVTGSGVSQWDDVSGNGNHLLQGTDTNRPANISSTETIVVNGALNETTDFDSWAETNVTESLDIDRLKLTSTNTATLTTTQIIPTIIGMTYNYSVTVEADAGNAVAQSAGITISNTSPAVNVAVVTNGTEITRAGTFVATATTSVISLRVASTVAWGGNGDIAYFKDVSITPTSIGVLCDGVDNFLFAASITLTQPFTTYVKVNQKTWTAGDVILGFGGGANRYVQQSGTTPQLILDTGASLGSISPVLNTTNVISAVANSTSSVLQLNNDTPVTGNAGTTAGTSLAIGTNNQVAGFAHAQYEEVILYTGAHDASTRTGIISYLNNL